MKIGLRLKILSGFVTLAVMLFVAGIWSISEIRQIGTSVQTLLDDNYTSISAAKKMKEALEREDSALLLLLLGKWQMGRGILASADSLFMREMENASTKLTIPGEAASLDSIRNSYARYKKLWERPIVGTKRQGDLDWYFNKVHDAFLAVNDAVEGVVILNEAIIYKTATNLHQKASRAIMPGIVAIVAALAFTIIFNFFANHYMVTPIVKITSGIRNFVDRKMPFDVDIETEDELSDLAFAIQTLTSMIKAPGDKE